MNPLGLHFVKKLKPIKMYPDYHMHTNFSDGHHTHHEMVYAADSTGLAEIGFTDHISLKPVGWAMDLNKLPELVELMNHLQRKSNSVAVRFGAEVDYIPGLVDQTKALIKSLPLDYVIGSVHFIDDWNFDTDINGYNGIDIDMFYRAYFRLIGEAAQTGMFDIIGHADLAKKFAVYPSFKLQKTYEQCAKIFKECDVVIELNTSGKNKPCAEFYPSTDFLEILHHYHVPITLGSDAHVEQNIGQYFNEAINLLKSLGYKEIIGFKQRNRIPIGI